MGEVGGREKQLNILYEKIKYQQFKYLSLILIIYVNVM